MPCGVTTPPIADRCDAGPREREQNPSAHRKRDENFRSWLKRKFGIDQGALQDHSLASSRRGGNKMKRGENHLSFLRGERKDGKREKLRKRGGKGEFAERGSVAHWQSPDLGMRLSRREQDDQFLNERGKESKIGEGDIHSDVRFGTDNRAPMQNARPGDKNGLGQEKVQKKKRTQGKRK